MDVDLVLSRSLYARFANPDRAQYVLQQVRSAWCSAADATVEPKGPWGGIWLRAHACRARVPRRAAVEQVMEEKKVFIIPAFDVRGQHERVAWADALVSNTSTKVRVQFEGCSGYAPPVEKWRRAPHHASPSVTTTHPRAHAQEMLAFAYHKGIVFQFAHDTYVVGHNMTDYQRWMQATGDYDVPYQAM